MITAIRRSLASLLSAAAALIFAVGVPLVLMRVGGNPLIALMSQVQRQAAKPISTSAVRPLAVLFLWLVWLLMAGSLVLEARATMKGIAVPRLRLLRPVQGVAAVVIASQAAGLFTPAAAAVNTNTTATAHDGSAPSTASVSQAVTTSWITATTQADANTATQTTYPHTHSVTLLIGTCGYTHKVVKGDSLWHIAKECLGDPQRWPEIWQLNKGKYWPHVSGHTKFRNPDLIFPGWVLTLPAGATVPPGAQPVDPPATQPPMTNPPATPQPTPPVSQTPSPPARPSAPLTTSASASPSTSPSDHDDSGDGVYPPPSQLPSGSPSRTAPPASPTDTVSPSDTASPAASAHNGDDEAPSASPIDGVDVPGGWITLGLAAGLLSAVVMVWRRRRHRYKPTPVTSPRLDDPDLLPPLAAMTRIRTSVRRPAPDALAEDPVIAPTVREYQAAAVKPGLPPIGPSGADLTGAARLPLTTGLGLTGAAALDAARGLLVATLASGSHDDPDAKGRAIIPGATLATLLGVSAVDLGHLDRLTVTASTADAITALEEEIIRRSRLIADAQAADVQALRDNDLYAEPLPQLLLITELPDPAWTNRLVTAVRLGHSVDIGAAMIGDWPTGTTLTVAADGTTGNDNNPRLAVLDTSAAIEMLGLLREAHGDSDSPAPTEKHFVAPLKRPARTPTAFTTDVDQAHDETVEEDAKPATDAPPAAQPTTHGQLPVTIQILGRPAIIGPNGQPIKGPRKAAIELMILLAVNRKGLNLIDIMDALYPHANMRRASERLSTTAADLRKHIRRAAAGAGDTEETLKKTLEPIPNTGSHYHLDPAIVTVDWWTVLDHYEAVAGATDDTQRLEHLTAGIDAATGPLADGVDYDWIDTDREFVRRHLIMLHAHAAEMLADSDPHRSWLLLEQACHIDPLSDHLARDTMRAAAVLGDADAVRHRLKTLREALDSNGLEIADETEDLAKELLRQLRPPHQSE